MKIYEKPTIEIDIFETVDVLFSSGSPWNFDIETPIIMEP